MERDEMTQNELYLLLLSPADSVELRTLTSKEAADYIRKQAELLKQK